MLWPCCAPPAQKDCFLSGYCRTCDLVQRLDAAAARAVQIFARNGKRGCTSKQEASAPAESCEVGDRGLLQSAQQRRRNNARSEFWESRKGCAAISFFCDTGLRDQLWVVTIPIEDTGDFVCGNFRRTVGDRVGGAGFQCTPIRAGGA